MRSVLIGSVRRYARRYVAAAVAVVIGVAFVVLINPLTSGTRSALLAGLDAPYRDADVVVTETTSDDASALLRTAQERGDRAAVQAWAVVPLSEGDRVIDRRGEIAALASDPDLRWQELTSGRYPEATGEVLADRNQAKSLDLGVGDIVTVGDRDLTVVGLSDTPSAAASGALYLTWPDLREWSSQLYVESIAYAGDGSVDDLRSAITDAAPDVEVQPADEYVDERAAELNQGVDVIAVMLLLFAAIAMAVSILVIANTFSVLFAQRTRDFALLRCVGATRTQVRRGVRIEALVLGLIASTMGVVVGVGAGYGLVAAVHAKWPDAMGSASLSPLWMGAAFVAGVVVTVLAGWLPTRKATRVSPLAALRPDEYVAPGSRAGRLRVGSGLLLTALGATGLALSVVTGVLPLMLLAGFTAFVGILVLGPVIVPWCIRRLGVVASWLFGAPGRLAVGNACRNPKRTAATTASLLIGVTLTTAMLTGIASSQTAVDADMDRSHPVDFVLDAPVGDALPAATADAVADASGVDRTATLLGGSARLDGERIGVVATSGDVDDVVHGDASSARPGPDEVVLPPDLAGEAFTGDRVTLTAGSRSVDVRVVEVTDSYGSAALLAPQTLERLVDDPRPAALWVRATGSADVEDLSGDLEAIASGADAELATGLAERAYVYQQLDIMTITVVVLLSIGVVIALIGIGSTLGLSVMERSREHALMRALGLTRTQLRRALTVEAVLLSVAATVIGTMVGVVFAWVGVEVLVKDLVEDTRLVIPAGQLSIAIAVSALAGLLACLLPARRAGRIQPAAGLVLD